MIFVIFKNEFRQCPRLSQFYQPAQALGFAVSWSAGVVFFCQNNHWAISAPVHVQSPVALAHRAAGFGPIQRGPGLRGRPAVSAGWLWRVPGM